MLTPPAWLASSSGSGKRGAGDQQPAMAPGAKLLRAADKGGAPKGGKKCKGRGKHRADEHPGATWASSQEWYETNGEWDWESWQGEHGEWGPSEEAAAEAAPAMSGGGGGRRPPGGRDRQRGQQVEIESAITSMQKLTLRNSADIRRAKHQLEDFWLLPLSHPAAKAGLEGARQYGIKIREQGRGHGLGPPHLTTALYFMQALLEHVRAIHSSEGSEEETSWAELTIHNSLKEAYADVYGQTVATETFKDFRVKEAHTEKKEEGLMSDEPISGMAKIEIAFNHNPLLHVALAPIKEKMSPQKLTELETYSTQDLRRATGYLLVKFGAKKGNASGPKTHLERAVEGNLRKIQSRTRR